MDFGHLLVHSKSDDKTFHNMTKAKEREIPFAKESNAKKERHRQFR